MIREKTLRIGIVVAMICAMVVLIACSSTSGGEPLQIVENDEPEQHIKIPEEYVGSWLVAASAEFADGKLIAKKAENRGIVSVSEESIALYKDDYESEISSNKYTIEGGNVAIEFDDGPMHDRRSRIGSNGFSHRLKLGKSRTVKSNRILHYAIQPRTGYVWFRVVPI